LREFAMADLTILDTSIDYGILDDRTNKKTPPIRRRSLNS
jgi:hypothetical protein